MSEHEDETRSDDEDPVVIPDDADEEAEAEADDEDESAPEPEPEPSDTGLSPEELEKRFGKVDASFKTYTNAVSRNLEEYSLDLIGCPLCSPTPHPAFINKHDMGRIPADVADNVKLVLGLKREEEYPPHPGVSRCATCAGLGKVQTGSLVPDHAKIVCPNCKGYGYNPPPGTSVGGTPANGAATASPLAAPPDIPEEDVDAWNEPRVLPDGTLNENFGKLPQYKKPHPVYGVTAGLTALDAA